MEREPKWAKVAAAGLVGICLGFFLARRKQKNMSKKSPRTAGKLLDIDADKKKMSKKSPRTAGKLDADDEQINIFYFADCYNVDRVDEAMALYNKHKNSKSVVLAGGDYFGGGALSRYDKGELMLEVLRSTWALRYVCVVFMLMLCVCDRIFLAVGIGRPGLCHRKSRV